MRITVRVSIPFTRVTVVVNIRTVQPVKLTFQGRVCTRTFHRFTVLPRVNDSPTINMIIACCVNYFVTRARQLLLKGLVIRSHIRRGVSAVNVHNSTTIRFPITNDVRLNFKVNNNIQTVRSRSRFTRGVRSTHAVIRLRVVVDVEQVATLRVFEVGTSTRTLSTLTGNARASCNVNFKAVLHSKGNGSFYLRGVLNTRSLRFIRVLRFPTIRVGLKHSAASGLPATHFTQGRKRLTSRVFNETRFTRSNAKCRNERNSILVRRVKTNALGNCHLRLLNIKVRASIRNELTSRNLQFVTRGQGLRRRVLVNVEGRRTSVLHHCTANRVDLTSKKGRRRINRERELLILVRRTTLSLFRPNYLTHMLGNRVNIILCRKREFPLRRRLRNFLLSLDLSVNNCIVLINDLVNGRSVLLTHLFGLLRRKDGHFVVRLGNRASTLDG